MNSTTLHPDILLTKGQKWAAWIVGSFLIIGALVIYMVPPQRESLETKNDSAGRTEEQRSIPADPTTLVIALASAGSILFVYGLNGIRIIRVSMSSLNLETLTAPLSNASTAGAAEIPKAASSPVPPESTGSPQQNLLEARVRAQVIDTFVRQSSWIGLKVLKACVLAKQKGTAFNLRASPVVGPQSSYDYCYGYLIASFALGALSGSGDPGTGIVVIENVDPTVAATVDEYIRGNIAIAPALSGFKVNEINAVNIFFEKLT
jgi:hypothetical protein